MMGLKQKTTARLTGMTLLAIAIGFIFNITFATQAKADSGSYSFINALTIKGTGTLNRAPGLPVPSVDEYFVAHTMLGPWQSSIFDSNSTPPTCARYITFGGNSPDKANHPNDYALYSSVYDQSLAGCTDPGDGTVITKPNPVAGAEPSTVGGVDQTGMWYFFYTDASNSIHPALINSADYTFSPLIKTDNLGDNGGALDGNVDKIYVQSSPESKCPALLISSSFGWLVLAPKPETGLARTDPESTYYRKVLSNFGITDFNNCNAADGSQEVAYMTGIFGADVYNWQMSYGKAGKAKFHDLTTAVMGGYGSIVDPTNNADAKKLVTSGLIDPKTATAASGNSVTTPTCGSEVVGLGWILCPVVNALTGLNDGMWRLVSDLLTVNPLDNADPVYTAWGTMRTLANLAFVVVFMIVIFSQLSGAGISNYGVKKMLPRLIVGAILVNLSFFVVQIAVDIANILGSSIYNLLVSITPHLTNLSWGDLVNAIFAGVGTVGAAAVAVALVGGAGVALWILLPMAALGALGLIAAMLTLIFRQAIIPVLAILAPLAFVAYLLPNTQSWYKKWQSLMVSMLMLYPLAALLFGGVRFAAFTVASSNPTFLTRLIGLIMMTLPLFSLPFLAKQGGPLLGKVAGALNGLANKAGKPLSNWAKPKQDLARDKYQATPASKYNIGKRMSLRGRRLGQISELKSAAYKAQQGADFSKDLRENTAKYASQMPEGSVAQSYIKGAASRAEAEALKSEMAPLTSEIAAEKARQGSAFDLDDFLRKRAKSSAHSETQRATAIHYAASLGRDNIMRELLEPGQDSETKRFAQEAISANAGSLVSKAPDLVKPPFVAFDTATGEDMTKFSAYTMTEYMRYLSNLHATASAPGATPKQRQQLVTATASFNSAIVDITKNPTLQAAFSSSSGTAILDALKPVKPGDQTPTSSDFKAYADTAMHGLAAVEPDGKIR